MPAAVATGDTEPKGSPATGAVPIPAGAPATTARPPGGVVARTFSSLRTRNYRLYFFGQSVSMVGTWMQSVSQSWLVYAWTRSGFDVGLVVALQTLPILLLGPIGGTLADRFGKYRMLFYTQAFAGLQAVALAALDFTGNLHLWELYTMAVCLGLINMVDNPTRQTFIVEMVGPEQLANAVTLNSVMANMARAVGPAVAGVLIASVGSSWCFLANAVSFIFVLGSLRAMDQGQLAPAPRVARLRGQLREGFRYVASTPLLRDGLIMMALIGCLTYEFQTTLPLMTGEAFHGNSSTYGFLTAFMGVGAVVGGLFAAGHPGRGMRRLVGTAALFGVAVLAAALAPSLFVEEAVLLAVGACSVTFLALGNATLQLNAEPSMRGRVMSLWSVAFLGSTPLGGPLVGFVGGQLGARYGLGLGALAALLAALYGWSRLRRDGVGAPAGTRTRPLVA
ncbi:MAG TPA: MFS transporter [Acidimicrobiales bacterium]|nr:MFS transporter [Acidimicrobiales bacterium]